MHVPSARNAFPLALKDDAEAVAIRLTSTSGLVPPSTFTVTVAGESVSIPSRVYFDEVALRAGYSALHLAILDCLQTRHHNGFVRERAVHRILDLNTSWSTPFVVQLVSEYVVEILDAIEANWAQIDERIVAQFLAENPRFHALVKQRVISYWNLHYPRPARQNYVGFKLLDKLERTLGVTRDIPRNE